MVTLLVAASVAFAPTLAEAQAAAARLAGGDASDDAARVGRARRAHWAPQVRVQAIGRQDERARRGELRLGPVAEDWSLVGRQWSVMITWDLSQVVFAREETQLALAHAQLERARREARTRVAELYADWLQLRSEPAALLELLRVTAELDGLTGGLFRTALERAQAQVEARR